MGQKQAKQDDPQSLPVGIVNTRETQPPMALDVFVDSVFTGDLLFLAGKSVKSKVLSYASWCDWTHVVLIDETDSLKFSFESQIETVRASV